MRNVQEREDYEKLETPPPTPPLEGRGEASPDLPEGEELAGAQFDGDDGAAAPLPSRGGVGGGVCNIFIHNYFLSVLMTSVAFGSVGEVTVSRMVPCLLAERMTQSARPFHARCVASK